MLNPVATTGLLVAAVRAEESQRSDRLFEDPFAAVLAGDAGREVLAQYRAQVRNAPPILEVRTRFFDEALLRANAQGPSQLVIVAAGMDARAYRLAFRRDTRLFELDQPSVIEAKARALASHTPRCQRIALPQDLAMDWPGALVAAGFDRTAPSLWLVEGLLQYLTASAVEQLFARIDSLAAPGSTLFFDAAGRAMLESPMVGPVREFMQKLGAPWLFGSDQPASLPGPNWTTQLFDAAAIGFEWGRWPFPPAPAHVPNVPRGYFVEALKR